MVAHRLHDLPRLPARHLSRRHRDPDRRREEAASAASSASSRASSIPPSRPSSRFFTEMGEAMRELAGQMGVSEVQELVGRPTAWCRSPTTTGSTCTSLLTPVRERDHHLAGRHAPLLPAVPPAAAPPGPRGRRRAARRRLALAVEEETDDRGRPQPWHRPGRAHRPRHHGRQQAAVGSATGTAATAPTTRGNGGQRQRANGHRPTLVDLAFTKGAAAGSGLAAFTPRGRARAGFGGAQDGVGKCALGRRDPGAEGPERASASGSAATWARASPTAPSAAFS